nr:transcription termination/antitermination protein NusA-like [Lytechinus pictus]
MPAIKKKNAENIVSFSGLSADLISGRKIAPEDIRKFVLEELSILYKSTINEENDLQIVPRGELDFELLEEFQIVSEVKNSMLEIDLAAAKKIDSKAKIGEKIAIPFSINRFSRLGVQKIAQGLRNLLSNIDNERIYNEYLPYKGTILTGKVENIEYHYYSLDIAPGVRAFIPKAEQLPREIIEIGQRLQFYVVDVFKTHSLSQILGSRRSDEFLKLLFRREVPEIDNGTIELVRIDREPGLRAKIGLKVHNRTIDPIGSCIGRGGSRINAICSQLNNEKIDLYIDQNNVIRRILFAITPAKVVSYSFADNLIRILVLEIQYPIAIGRFGSAIRLLSKLSEREIEILIFEEVAKSMDKIPLNGHLLRQDLEKLDVDPELLSKCYDVEIVEENED